MLDEEDDRDWEEIGKAEMLVGVAEQSSTEASDSELASD